MSDKQNQIQLDRIDRAIIGVTQKGLPVSRQPYHDVAEQLDLKPEDVLKRMQRMLENKIIRRIGVVPDHYSLGYRANGMSVWDVPDERIREFGQRIGQLDFVSHCYHRPRHLPEWPYNLFAMVHGKSRAVTDAKIRQIVELLGEDVRAYDVLYSTRILKKTGLRINSNLEPRTPGNYV